MKADLAIYSLVVGMSGLWVNVATMLNNKLDFYCCDNSVGFCKSSHIYIYMYVCNSCNMGSRDLPVCPRAEGIHIRQITKAHVTTTM